ncbi:MAG: ComF family protein [Bacteroidetes bacterium]|nr:ComF family protein [Bacteroidota bacterium]
MKQSASWIFGDIGRLFYPQLCAGCRSTLYEAEQGICAACVAALPRTAFKSGSENPAARMFHGRVKFMGVHSFLYFHKAGITQSLLHQIKYRGGVALAYQMGQLFGHTLEPRLLPDVLIPVPLHASRRRERGYNQSEALAQGMAAAWHLEVNTNIMSRTAASRSQTKSGRFNRWNNVGSRFECRNVVYPKEIHIGLVDDVLTTGSTLESCARALEQVGYRNLSAFTLAYAEY